MACLPNNTDQLRVPLLDALADYSGSIVSLHMPAHNCGAAAPAPLRDFAGQQIFRLDQTEVPGLDDLHNPSGIIAESQRLAAKAFGADRTFFLINGTSCGIHALLAGHCPPGAKVLLPRNMHKSVLWGLIISGADPVYTPVRCLDEFGVVLADVAGMEEAMKANPDAAAIMIANPTYHGLSVEIRTLAGLAHSFNVPLLVDEAHGAHLRFHPELPIDAMSAGADAAVQSTHKLGGSLTQSSMLHLQGDLVDREKTAEILSMTQTTSPSYILMCSLDAARYQLVTRGRELLERAIGYADLVRKQAEQLKGVDVLTPGHLKNGGLPECALDYTKILLSATRLGLSGYEFSEILRSRYSIQVEYADFLNVLCMITIGTTRKDCERLVFAVRDISASKPAAEMATLRKIALENAAALPQKAMTPRAAWLAKRRAVPLDACVGEISAESVAVYPPGIPALLPGEIITAEIQEYLIFLRKMGVPLQGPRDAGLGKLEVVNG